MSEERPQPDLMIKVEGAELPLSARRDVISVTVQEDLGAAGMFTIELANWDDRRLRVTWSDHTLFAPGGEVEISLGYTGKLGKVLTGEIISLEPSFSAASVPTLSVRGYDHSHRLRRGDKTRSFLNMKDSAIAQTIAGEAGLSAEVEDSEVVHQSVLQSNQADMAFLEDRAGRIGYEVFVKHKVLYFRKPKSADDELLTLAMGGEITVFSPRLSLSAQVSGVTVRGWDVKKKEPFEVTVQQGSGGAMGDTIGPLAAKRAFGKSQTLAVDRGAASKADAGVIARGMFQAMALTYITGDGTCAGEPKLTPGGTVKITGVGERFSGLYYVTSVTHTLSTGGYETRFSYQRDAT